MDCGVSCPLPNEKTFYLLENYSRLLAYSQVRDRCPLGYLLHGGRVVFFLYFMIRLTADKYTYNVDEKSGTEERAIFFRALSYQNINNTKKKESKVTVNIISKENFGAIV